MDTKAEIFRLLWNIFEGVSSAIGMAVIGLWVVSFFTDAITFTFN